MDLCHWLNKFYCFYMAAVFGIVSRRGLCFYACHINQINRSKLALYKPLIHIYSRLKQFLVIKMGLVVRALLHCICIDIFKEELAWATDN